LDPLIPSGFTRPQLHHARLTAVPSLPWLKTYSPNGLQKPTER
jgi:hypothetical protein